ncbi:alpha/beta fold hydrolase [Noviherbaspirillum sedimenti]|uniref:alpha/beta fold hydrolase n=1 Tax=Noviherbaspirillum sedimenti TaxID=2320865 RepID=UPI0030839CF4
MQLAIAAAIAYVLKHFFGMHIASAMLSAAGMLLLLRMLITANNFRLSWRFRSDTPPAERITLRHAWRLYLEEFRASLFSSSWSMPFGAFAGHHSAKSRGLPVLLIHGYGCNSGYWRSMSRLLGTAGITHRAVSLEPVFGDIDSFVPAVHAAVENLCHATGSRRVVLLAHSMGGLVARAYLCAHGEARIARVITLGTPHHGTGLANFGLGSNSEQMRWVINKSSNGNSNACSGEYGDGRGGTPSAWLQELAAREGPQRYGLFTSIYSHHDNIIAPQTSAHLPGARNIALHGVGHVALGLNPQVQKIVIDEILAAAPDAG